jgi:hypothetical protein
MQQLNRLYVLVREDLGPSYSAVQAGHAVAQYMVEFPDLWRNHTLIYLRVKNEKELLEWRDKMIMRSHPYALFREPDIRNEATAMAVQDTGKIFSKLALL